MVIDRDEEEYITDTPREYDITIEKEKN